MTIFTIFKLFNNKVKVGEEEMIDKLHEFEQHEDRYEAKMRHLRIIQI